MGEIQKAEVNAATIRDAATVCAVNTSDNHANKTELNNGKNAGINEGINTGMNTVKPQKRDQNFTNNQQETIQALIRDTLAKQGVQLEYEDFEGYEVPPRSQFSVMKKPAVSIKNGQMTFNMACIRLFKGTPYIVPLLHSRKKRLAIIPCVEEENASIEWSRQKNGEYQGAQFPNLYRTL